MRLLAYQRAIAELSFAEQAELSPELAPFALYRSMIRARMFAMAQVAYRRTWSVLGDAACTASFARYLSARPPRSPLIREVVATYESFAIEDALLLDAGPPHTRDLICFEAAKWRVASAPWPLQGVLLRELDFDGILVLNPTLMRVALGHLVGDDQGACPRAEPHVLWVYRRRDDDDVRWYRAPALLCELLALAESSRVPLGVLLRQLFSPLSLSADQAQAQLAQLVAELTVAVERDVILGVCGAA